MKKPLLFAALLLSSSTMAQTPAPAKGATSIIVHSPDSARVAYNKMLKAITVAGYGIDKSDKEALFVSTPSKPVDGAVGVKLQAVVTATPTGSDIIFRGLFTWVNSLTIQAGIQNRELPIQFAGGENGPSKRAWREMQKAAGAALPGATVDYK